MYQLCGKSCLPVELDRYFSALAGPWLESSTKILCFYYITPLFFWQKRIFKHQATKKQRRTQRKIKMIVIFYLRIFAKRRISANCRVSLVLSIFLQLSWDLILF
jgi:hypothetical protein